MKEHTLNDRYFSKTYAEARCRFLNAAATLGANTYAYALVPESPDELTIDVAVIGTDDDPALVVSSGVHGVEGFFGSAVQLALLERLKQTKPHQNVRYVLVHGLNPFGFAHLRRVNEDNVDLNRNFITNPGNYTGAPDGYARLNGFLNPESPPARFEPFKLKAFWHIWRTGLPALKNAIAGGQYEYPRGLFFGGEQPCRSTQIAQDNCDTWLANSQRIVQIDFHTGLGAYGTYKLLLGETADSEHYPWYTATFGTDCIEPFGSADETAYQISGLLGQWLQQYFSHRDYRFVTAEFGTYDIIRVLAALRAENRAHHYGYERTSPYQRAKLELLECFCPASPSWRHQAVGFGLRIVDQGTHALLRAADDG